MSYSTIPESVTISNIDLPKLKQQRELLFEAIKVDPNKFDELNGLVHFIDDIADKIEGY